MKKFSFVGLLFVVVMSMVLSACSSGSSGSSEEGFGEIHFYSPETPDMTKDIAAAFEEKYPGSEVSVNYAGTNVLVNQMIAEKANPNADLWYGGGGFLPFAAAAEKGILASFTPKLAEDWKVTENGVKLHNEDWKWTGAEIFVLGFSYNTELVSEEEAPKTWDDLLDPKWKGKIQFPNPAASGTATLMVLSQMMMRGEDEGWKYFEKLHKQANRIPDSGSAPTKAVAKGEASIGIGFSFMAYEQKLGNGEDVGFVIPKKTAVLVNPVALIKGGPNPEGGKKFINFLLSEEGQKILADWYHLPINPNVEAKTPLTVEEAKKHAIELDVDWVTSNYDRIRKEWGEKF